APVAPVVAPVASSQSANGWRSPLKVRNVRIGCSSRSAGTATTWNVAPTSSPAALGLIVVSCPDDRARVLLLAAMLHLPCEPREQEWAQEITFLNGIAWGASPLSSAPATPGPCFLTGSRRHHYTHR